MTTRPALSEYATAKSWLLQFSSVDRPAAARMLDAMLLLNEDQVSAAIRTQLYELASLRKGKRRRVALYAEREFGGTAVFESKMTADSSGRMHMRAVGRRGPSAVSPVRGSPRVGSEGLIAFVISQAKDTWPRIFMNHPGPDLIRGRTNPAGSIAIVTDFIGSGNRVRRMLDAFWAVPSVRAWHSRRWIDFKVVAAAGTALGEARVRGHHLRPEVIMQYVAPTVGGAAHWRDRERWYSLINSYGPDAGRGTGRYGFGDTAALIAFNYRIPNNTPALVHRNADTWKALFDGSAPADLWPAFDLKAASEVISAAAEDYGITLSTDLPEADAGLVVVLSLMRGRWRLGAEIALAERTGMRVPDVVDVLRKALHTGLVTKGGRLTDKGQAVLVAGRRSERKRPVVPTDTRPYYPNQLRTPRVSSSTRRPFWRP